jgi:hypothetical protein
LQNIVLVASKAGVSFETSTVVTELIESKELVVDTTNKSGLEESEDKSVVLDNANPAIDTKTDLYVKDGLDTITQDGVVWNYKIDGDAKSSVTSTGLDSGGVCISEAKLDTQITTEEATTGPKQVTIEDGESQQPKIPLAEAELESWTPTERYVCSIEDSAVHAHDTVDTTADYVDEIGTQLDAEIPMDVFNHSKRLPQGDGENASIETHHKQLGSIQICSATETKQARLETQETSQKSMAAAISGVESVTAERGTIVGDSADVSGDARGCGAGTVEVDYSQSMGDANAAFEQTENSHTGEAVAEAKKDSESHTKSPRKGTLLVPSKGGLAKKNPGRQSSELDQLTSAVPPPTGESAKYISWKHRLGLHWGRQAKGGGNTPNTSPSTTSPSSKTD